MELAGKKVLVTGGAGFIGSNLVDMLLRLGSNVVVYDNFNDFYPGKETNVAAFADHKRFRLIRGDILDADSLETATSGVDVVFHLAAQAGVRYCLDHPMAAHQSNVTGTLNVLEAARKKGVKKLVYGSSSSIYGVPVKIPMDEGHPQIPTNIYGATKLAAERYCLAYHKSFGLEVVCLRYFSVYGPRGRPDQVVASFADSIMRGRPPRIFGDGSYSRDFTFVSDIVSATAMAAMRDVTGEVFNVGFGKDYTVNVVAEKIAKYFDSPIRPEHVDSYAADFPRTLCSNAKALRILRWRPEVTFDKGLEKTLDWFMARAASSMVPSTGRT